MKVRSQQGFTLIEIAIVLLIIGLLLGGVMKGQSMINSAKVRSLANDLTGIEAAWISFQDRYRALPGDYPNANTHIATDAVGGNANSIVDTEETGDVWQHLAAAGFISGTYKTDDTCAVGTCPSSPFNGFYSITNSANALGHTVARHELATGENIPVEIIFELDLKLDDGIADTGRFRAYGEACVTGGQWEVVAGAANCQGVLRL